MTNLPPELLHLIIADPSTSAALALVNKYYNRVVTPILYEKVVLAGRTALKAFSGIMVTSEPIKLKIKSLLVHVPNLIDLHLNLDALMVNCLLDGYQYPFQLHSLKVIPPRKASFIEFLKTQPQTEHVYFMSDPRGTSFYRATGWQGIQSTLEPHVLPNLKSVISNKVDAYFLVLNHPVTSLSIRASHEGIGFHRDLEFHEAESALTLLKTPHNASRGLEKLRESLSAFSKLRKFRLELELCEDHELTAEFIGAVPELSQFDPWKESCPKLEEINLFGISLGR
ncbi:hypothetical protein RSAG8_06936, partial [Rhizoctonia solani AG-8 WAC10335]